MPLYFDNQISENHWYNSNMRTGKFLDQIQAIKW